jgi:DNA replication protein DnaC
MKKEEIYVEINNEEEKKLAIQILEKAGEKYCKFRITDEYRYLVYNQFIEKWDITDCEYLDEITLLQLAEFLNPKTTDTLIEDFKQQMRDKGLEVSVVIEREIIQPNDIVMYKKGVIKHFCKFGYIDSHENYNIVKVTDPNIIKFLNL